MEATTYVAQVQALSRLGPGRTTSIQFTTPLLQASPVDPPYRELEANHNDLERRQPDNTLRKQGGTTTVFPSSVPHSSSTFGLRPDVLLRNSAVKHTSKLFIRNLASNIPGCLCLVTSLWVFVDSLLQWLYCICICVVLSFCIFRARDMKVCGYFENLLNIRFGNQLKCRLCLQVRLSIIQNMN